MFLKTAFLFWIPCVWGYFYGQLDAGRNDFDLVLMAVALICSAVGSWAQYYDRKQNKTELPVIILFGVLVAIVSFALGNWKREILGMTITLLVSSLGSYMSIPLLRGIKSLTTTIKPLFIQIVKSKFKVTEEKEDNTEID